MPQPDHAPPEQIVCVSVTSAYERVVWVMHEETRRGGLAMMWGLGPWTMGPMGAFWWIFPVIGFLICLFVIVAMVRMMSGGGRFGCMGPHHADREEMARLRREVDDLREQMRKQGAAP